MDKHVIIAKRIVIGMTALLGIMIIALIYGLQRKSNQMSEGIINAYRPAAASAPASTNTAPRIGSLPAGKIISLSPAGAYLAVLMEHQGQQSVILLDPATQNVQSILKPQTP